MSQQHLGLRLPGAHWSGSALALLTEALHVIVHLHKGSLRSSCGRVRTGEGEKEKGRPLPAEAWNSDNFCYVDFTKARHQGSPELKAKTNESHLFLEAAEMPPDKGICIEGEEFAVVCYSLLHSSNLCFWVCKMGLKLLTEGSVLDFLCWLIFPVYSFFSLKLRTRLPPLPLWLLKAISSLLALGNPLSKDSDGKYLACVSQLFGSVL